MEQAPSLHSCLVAHPAVPTLTSPDSPSATTTILAVIVMFSSLCCPGVVAFPVPPESHLPQLMRSRAVRLHNPLMGCQGLKAEGAFRGMTCRPFAKLAGDAVRAVGAFVIRQLLPFAETYTGAARRREPAATLLSRELASLHL